MQNLLSDETVKDLQLGAADARRSLTQLQATLNEQRGRIAGAALDVFLEEPTTESPLFAFDRYCHPLKSTCDFRSVSHASSTAGLTSRPGKP